MTSRASRAGGACPLPNSFAPGTLVVMGDGTLAPIETLTTGNLVLSTDPLTGQTQAQPLLAPITGTGVKHLIDITTDAGTWTATANHPIWVSGKGWTLAEDLTPGDHLVGSTGGLLVVQATHDHGWLSGQTVHNLSVGNTHTYYIATPDGNLDALVHNCPGAASLNYTAMAGRHEAGTAIGGRSVFVGVSGANAARVATRFGVRVPRPGGAQYVVGPFARPVGLTPAGLPLHCIRATIRSNGNVHAWPAARGVWTMELNDLERRALQALDLYLMHSVWLSDDGRATLIGGDVARLVEGGGFEWMEVELAAIGATTAAYDAQEGPSCRFAVRVGDESVITVYVSVLAPWALVALFRWPGDQPDEKRRFLAVQTSRSHAPEAARIVALLSAWGFYLASEAQCNCSTGLPAGDGGAVLSYHELLFEYKGYSEPPWSWR